MRGRLNWRSAGLGAVAALAVSILGSGESDNTSGAPQKTALGESVAKAPSEKGGPAPAAREVPVSPSGSDVQRLFESGNEAFRAGLAKAKTDRGAAEALFRDAAGAWRAVAKSGIHNVRLETNIANASLLGGDLPRAIAAYRRAQAIDPLDADVRGGLLAARRAAGTEALAPGAAPAGPAADEGGVLGTVKRIGSFLASSARRTEAYFPSRLLMLAVCVLYVGAFVAGIAKMTIARRIPVWIPVLMLLAGLLSAGPLVARELGTRAEREAVIVQPNVLGRNGPADLYDPAFKEPLRAGLEVRIEETRAGWAKIRLADGRSAWVRESGLERL